MIRIDAFRGWRMALALLAGLALAGCASYGGSGGYGNSYPGNNGGYYPGGGYGDQYRNQRFVATVVGMDARGGRLVLDLNQRDYRQQRVNVYFDNNTRLYYQRRLYPVTGLERGDVIQVDVVESRGRLWATNIQVVRNIREYGGYRY